MTQRIPPEVEWEPAGPGAVECAVHRGRDEVSSGSASDLGDLGGFPGRGDRALRPRDSVVWLGRAHLRGGTSHLAFDQPFAVDFPVCEGKIVSFSWLPRLGEALEAAGL